MAHKPAQGPNSISSTPPVLMDKFLIKRKRVGEPTYSQPEVQSSPNAKILQYFQNMKNHRMLLQTCVQKKVVQSDSSLLRRKFSESKELAVSWINLCVSRINFLTGLVKGKPFTPMEQCQSHRVVQLKSLLRSRIFTPLKRKKAIEELGRDR
ncbi:hypothetical protein LguiB_032238 [Lonicera macranthoides]